MDKFIKPFYEDSIILTQRAEIQESPYLNQFLYDNMVTIEEIFNIACNIQVKPRIDEEGNLMPWILSETSNGKFSIAKAYVFFGELVDDEYEMTMKTI